MSFELLPPREQLAQIMRRLYEGGLTTLSGGNLSIKDADGSIWITPSGVDKGGLRPEDMMRITPEGAIEGVHRPSMEAPFHMAIYASRPDVSAIVHAHPPALITFSIARIVPQTHIIPQAQKVCGRVGYAPYATPGSTALGQSIAGAFAEGNDCVLLENHGAVTAGGTLLEAYQRMETLDFCARTLLRARAIGMACALTDDQLALADTEAAPLPEFTPTAHSSHERAQRMEVARLLHRACDRQLMIATEGVISARVGPDTFIITPTGQDRRYVEHDDLVLIQGGQREAGKHPSRSVRMHEAIYAQHPSIGAIITSQPPNAMAYAVTACQFDSRTIPESYIMLRDVPLVPYGLNYADPAAVARLISDRRPVAIIQNDCALMVGANVLAAFDRLEILEFSARSLIDTLQLGALQPMPDEALIDLRRAFGLPE